MSEPHIGEGTHLLTNQDCDVLIVGAGISGLTSARELLKADPSLKVIFKLFDLHLLLYSGVGYRREEQSRWKNTYSRIEGRWRRNGKMGHWR